MPSGRALTVRHFPPPAGLLLVLAASAASAQPAPATAPSPTAENTLTVTPERLRQELTRAQRFLAERRFDEALSPLDLIVRVQPRHAGAWMLRSRALLGVGRAADARDAATRSVELLEAEPKERRAAWGPSAFYEQLGLACDQAGDLSCATQALTRADHEKPNQAPVLRALGSVLLRSGHDAEASLALTHAVELDAKQPQAQVDLGNARLHLGDAAGAETAFRAAIELAPALPEAHFGLSQVAAARADEATRSSELATFDKLRTERDERIAAARRVDDAMRSAGEAMSAGRFADAAKGYEAALAEPIVAGGGYQADAVLINLGASRAHAGDVPGAADAFAKAAAANPRSASAQLEWGNLLAGQGLVDEAFPHLLRATELDPMEVEPHSSLALAWAALGKLDAAVTEAAKASLLKPEDVTLRQQYVDLLAASGRVAEADELARQNDLVPPGGPSAAGETTPSPSGQTTPAPAGETTPAPAGASGAP
jgi:Flp pilus assembly protein TadD